MEYSKNVYESLESMVKYGVAENGRLSNVRDFVQRSEFGSAVDRYDITM
ncbi:hypothetical protein JW824_01135 [bacterium]|nr:hypothetical protein [bacterium]